VCVCEKKRERERERERVRVFCAGDLFAATHLHIENCTDTQT